MLLFCCGCQCSSVFFLFYSMIFNFTSVHEYFTFYVFYYQICIEREKVESDMTQVKDEWRAKLRDTERLNSNELSVLQKDLNEQVNIYDILINYLKYWIEFLHIDISAHD